MKHLSAAHASTKLTLTKTLLLTLLMVTAGEANLSSANTEGHGAVGAATAGCFCSSFINT